MLDAAFGTNGLAPLLDAVLSVEAVGRYKPAPAVYQLATEALGAAADELLFVSANAWDIAGAGSAGLVTAWINRSGAPADRLPEPPSYELTALSDVPDIVAAG
jgi:2-haloacid dehalogenase